jgi:hypothetical protein
VLTSILRLQHHAPNASAARIRPKEAHRVTLAPLDIGLISALRTAMSAWQARLITTTSLAPLAKTARLVSSLELLHRRVHAQNVALVSTLTLLKVAALTVQLDCSITMTMPQHPAPPALMGLPQTLAPIQTAVPPAEQAGMRQQHCVEMTQTTCVLAVSLVSTMMTAPQTLRVLAAMLVVFQWKLERQRVLHAQQGRTVLRVRQLALTVPLARVMMMLMLQHLALTVMLESTQSRLLSLRRAQESRTRRL